MIFDIVPVVKYLLNLSLARPHGPIHDGTFISGTEMLACW